MGGSLSLCMCVYACACLYVWVGNVSHLSVSRALAGEGRGGEGSEFVLEGQDRQAKGCYRPDRTRG